VKLDDYQRLTNKTAQYPGFEYLGLKLNGEIAELSVEFLTGDKVKIEEEAGDVLWYLAQIAERSLVNLSSLIKYPGVNYEEVKDFTFNTYRRAIEVEKPLMYLHLQAHIAAGHVAEQMGKSMRGPSGVISVERRIKILQYTSDTLYFLLATLSKFDVDKIARDNLKKLEIRYAGK